MNVLRLVRAIVPLLFVYACTGGGSGESVPAPGPAWEKFRHDIGNTGGAAASIETNVGTQKWAVAIDDGPTPQAVSASPAVATDGSVYIGTEGGTLAALNPADGSFRWKATSCGACPAAAGSTDQPLGRLISSPAVYQLNGTTSVFVGSTNGSLLIFESTGTNAPTCPVCFRPAAADFGSSATIDASFVSSPSFTTNVATAAVSGIFIGAAVDVTQQGSTRTVGKLYAINTDGSVRWQFPRHGDREIAAVTSSAAIGVASTVYFTDADDILYALAVDGTLKWTYQFPSPTVADPSALFAPSPLSVNQVYVTTLGGDVFAINPNGTFRWSLSSPDHSPFIASLASGGLLELTPTPTPAGVATPTPGPPGTATPTATETPQRSTLALFAITRKGTVLAIEDATGQLTSPQPAFPTSIVKPVVSSPALSVDSFLVFGAGDGKLYALNTGSGAPPAGAWPVQLTAGAPIRSSPAIGGDGTIYVGADDGKLYAIGTP